MAAMTVDGPQVDDKNPNRMPPLFNPNGGIMPSAYVPQQNPNLQSSLANQLASAKQYRQNIPQMSDQLYGDYASTARQSLASNLKSVDKDFNRRGLLRSGMHTGAQYGVQAENQNDLASARAKINQGLLNTADQMDTGVYNSAGNIANTGYNMTGALTSGAQTDLDRQQADAASNQALWSSIFRSGGTIAGSAFGSKGNGTSNTSSNYGGGQGVQFGSGGLTSGYQY